MPNTLLLQHQDLKKEEDKKKTIQFNEHNK